MTNEFESGEQRWGDLKNGVGEYHVGEYDNDESYVESLAFSQREDISGAPVALLDQVAYGYDDDGLVWSKSSYRPFVVIFDEEILNDKGSPYWNDDGSPYIVEKSKQGISAENNSFWEGVFQYDINKDGSIPAYVPPQYPLVSEPDQDVDGKKINGTKKDDILKGSKKDDCINGKKGDDSLEGKKGDDILLGGGRVLIASRAAKETIT